MACVLTPTASPKPGQPFPRGPEMQLEAWKKHRLHRTIKTVHHTNPNHQLIYTAFTHRHEGLYQYSIVALPQLNFPNDFPHIHPIFFDLPAPAGRRARTWLTVLWLLVAHPSRQKSLTERGLDPRPHQWQPGTRVRGEGRFRNFDQSIHHPSSQRAHKLVLHQRPPGSLAHCPHSKRNADFLLKCFSTYPCTLIPVLLLHTRAESPLPI